MTSVICAESPRWSRKPSHPYNVIAGCLEQPVHDRLSHPRGRKALRKDHIHTQCVTYGTEPDGYINYMKGANIAGFMKVADAMMGEGVC